MKQQRPQGHYSKAEARHLSRVAEHPPSPKSRTRVRKTAARSLRTSATRLTRAQRYRKAAALLAEWMADDSGYDEMVGRLLDEELMGDSRHPAQASGSLSLTTSDQAWLDAYRATLAAQYPGAVKRFLIYGSKARREAASDSDLDVVLIVDPRWLTRKRELRRIGYRLAATSDVVPSIMVYTDEEWEVRRQHGSFFRRAVERDAIAL